MGITMLHIDAITFLTKVVILTLQSNNFFLLPFTFLLLGKISSPFYYSSLFIAFLLHETKAWHDRILPKFCISKSIKL